MLTYQIRGGLGTQLLNLMAAYGDAFNKDDDIEKVVLNFFNYPEGLREINIDFISKIINTNIKVDTTDGTNKFPIFNQERIRKVHKFIEKIRSKMPVKKTDQEPAGCPIIHVRQIDRPLVSVDTYKKIVAHIPTSMVIGDDTDVVSKIIEAGQVASLDKYPLANRSTITSPYNNDSVEEWFMVYNSKIVVGGFSSYILSAALLYPNLSYHMLSRESCNEGMITDGDWKCLDLFTELFDNIDWMEYEHD